MISLITGCNGFTGKYLAEYIKKLDCEIVTIGTDLSAEKDNNFIDKYYTSKDIDLLFNYISNLKDDVRVFHLAGMTVNGDVEQLINVNVNQSLKYIKLSSELNNLDVFLNVGSSAIYGKQKEKYLREDLKPNPVTNYGISKLLQEELAIFYLRNNKKNVIATRTFNLSGPGLGEHLVLSSLARQFAMCKKKEIKSVNIGRTDSIRNFIDVRDAVKIYWELAEKGISGEVYNVGHAESYSINQIIELLEKITGQKPEIIKKNPNDSNFDIDYQYSDNNKLVGLIGEKKLLDVMVSLEDMCNFYSS